MSASHAEGTAVRHDDSVVGVFDDVALSVDAFSVFSDSDSEEASGTMNIGKSSSLALTLRFATWVFEQKYRIEYFIKAPTKIFI